MKTAVLGSRFYWDKYNNMEEILNDYIAFIKTFENKMIVKYNLEKNPWNVRRVFDRKGVIDEYHYTYHGVGCRLESEGIICEYDVAPLDGKEIKFDSWNFWEFANTYPKYKPLQYTIEYIEEELLKLIDRGILSFMEIDGRIFQVYEVN